MDNAKCQIDYNYLTTHTLECDSFVKSHTSLCTDKNIQNSYSSICSVQKNLSNERIDGESNLLVKGSFIILVFLSTIFVYIIYIKIRNFIIKKRQTYKLQVRFPYIKQEEEDSYIALMESFFASLKTLLKRESMSFEVYKVNKYIEIVITSTNKRTLESIKHYLTNIKGIKIMDLINDPIELFSKPNIRRYYLRNNYYTINLNEKNFFKSLINAFSSLEEDEKGAVAFLLRSIDLTHSIDKEVKKYKQFTNQKESSISKNLLRKRSKNNYLVQIYSLADSSDTNKKLASIFDSLNEENIFINTSTIFPIFNSIKKRFIEPKNIFTSLLRPYFGSYFNSSELATMLHPTVVNRGAYRQNECEVLEAPPEFLNKKKDNILIGKSVLNNGQETKIYFPIENFKRHAHIVGKTGVGKSTLIKNFAKSLIENEDKKSVIIFDPHGNDLVDVALRLKDWENIIYFNLGKTNKTPTFNPLFSFNTTNREKDRRKEQVISILREESFKRDQNLGTSIEKLLSFLVTTAIHFPDAYFRYITVEKKVSPEKAKEIVMERQITFPDLPSILRRNSKFSNLMKIIFKNYEEPIGLNWTTNLQEYALQTAILDGLENRLQFLVKDSLIPFFEGSKFNIVDIVASQKHLLFPLTIESFGVESRPIVTKLLLNELWLNVQSIEEKKRNETVIFIDEFQNAQLEVMKTILSEARKYKISLVLGNQYLSQLYDDIRDAILGNVGSIFPFQLGRKEAEFIAPVFNGKVDADDISSLSLFNGYLKTTNPELNKDTALLSFITLNFDEEFAKQHSEKDLEELNEKSLDQYGEDISILKQRHLNKLKDPEKYFLGDL